MELNYEQVKSTVKPSEIMKCANTIYLRKDITPKEEENSFGVSVIWYYQEAKLTLDEYENFSKFAGINSAETTSQVLKNQETGDDNQLSIMEAIADLYEIIANMSSGGVS